MIKSSTCSSSESAVIQQVGACLICENFREQSILENDMQNYTLYLVLILYFLFYFLVWDGYNDFKYILYAGNFLWLLDVACNFS
jgi:hypothetical protein